ncbi:Mediator of RNA polymerase II transcription subunit 13, partial [Stegodyphus mimosarum]
MGHDSDYITLSPFALRYWDKLLLEPYSLPRDVAYIVVAPENDVVLSHIKTFFRELSSTYELHNLGKHCPITKVLRDGIMRVGKTAASKVAEEPLSEWFNSIGDSPTANKLKLYARVCKHRLAPHLSTLSLDRSIFESTTSSKSSERPSGNLSSTQLSGDNEKPATPKQSENDTNGELHVESSACSQDSADDDYRHLPALVIYIVEPFTFAQYDSSLYRLVTLGLLHSYADMLPDLPEATRNSMHLQLLSLDAIMCFGSSSGHRKDEIKTLALSVFSQSHHLVTHQSSVKSLTGFGPAAAEKAFLNSKKDKIERPMKMYNRPFILASVKDKQAELGEMFGDRRENSGVLYCSYCLTKDKRFILACCTNDKGEFTETNVININIPNRNKRKQTSVRKFGLRKLLDFILEVISASSHPWRLIIARFGRLGHGELKAWASLLSRKSLQSYARHLKELCGECAISGIADTPSILSVCLVSLEPDSSLRLMPDQFTLDDHSNNTRQQMYSRTTPDNSTYTHILVFPTSATTQSSQATFPSEDIDPLPGGLDEGLFEGLNDNDITGPDINDIFKWTESPQSPEGSSHRDSNSQPPSPSTSFRLSSSNHGGPNRCDSMSENTDEPLQLLQQPLALGYFVSTAKTGLLPKWFWSSCPHLEDKSPAFLKSALLIHLPFVQQNSDDLLHHNSQQQSTCHPL